MNDVQVTLLNGAGPGLYDENFGATPGNNPAWITSFVGSTAEGTGNGTAGLWTTLNTSSATNSVQFDFSIPLAAGDRILIADVDNTEKYQLQAFAKVGPDYVAQSLVGWLHQDFSGWTGVTPDARWAVWDGATGYLTATGTGLSEPLTVLTVDQSIDRIVFFTTGGGGGTPTIQFASTIGGLPGDYNHNGTVDAADYVVWRDGLGSTYIQDDYDVWRSHYGQSVGGGLGAASAVVPEPAPGPLLLIGVVLASRRGTDRARQKPDTQL